MTRPTRYFPAVDGLRAFAVMAVLVFHGFQDRFPGAFLGVDVFFVISGFVITTALLRERDLNGHVGLRRFYLRRFWRLMPALLAAVVLSGLLQLVAGTEPKGRWAMEALAALTYTYNLWQGATLHGNALLHTWSLGIEEQFYLAWPPVLVFALARKASRSVRVVGMIVVLMACRVLTVTLVGSTRAFFLPWSRMDELLVGALLALLAAEGRAGWVRRQSLAWAAVAALLVACVTISEFSHSMLYGGYTLLAVTSALVVGHAAFGESLLQRALASPPTVWLGQRSYGVYLYHFPIIVACHGQGLSASLSYLITLVVSVILAAASFAWLERPLRQWATYSDRTWSQRKSA